MEGNACAFEQSCIYMTAHIIIRQANRPYIVHQENGS
ncbi:hypothetical protein GGR38_001166 [Novosphingobium sediminicola]|uniref:Uncharacterized protein n=1 Tax=Novosphingobium sediminicola TaxID=563162 RepID=A0A7W6CCW1_9SPHN|nr:hypothetical protein [Novosphingobium sediminicola]